MASGRPDYTSLAVIRSSVYGYTPEIIFNTKGQTLVGGADGEFMNYEIPVGYKFTVQGFYITCKIPGIVKGMIGKNGSDFLIVYFDTNYSIFNEKGIIEPFDAGDVLSLLADNLLSDSALMYASYYGILEYSG